MKSVASVVALVLCLTVIARAADQARVLTKVEPLPVALSHDFEFRKTKLFLLGRAADLQTTDGTKKKKLSGRSGNRATAAAAEASINFESRYRLFGAVTTLDVSQRTGNYFDFFWRAKRHADITVRLEYRQEQLRAATQAREIRYEDVHGNQKTEFAIIGDDFLDDGRVIAWRCLLIENGHVVAENRSYLWR